MNILLPQAPDYGDVDESFFGESYASETEHGESEGHSEEAFPYLEVEKIHAGQRNMGVLSKTSLLLTDVGD